MVITNDSARKMWERLKVTLQERLTAKEAMSHPYFNPVRQQERL